MKNKFCKFKDIENEASVEALFVNRLLQDLGYEDHDIQYKVSLKKIKVGKGSKSEKYRPDYILMINEMPKIVIDAKNTHETIDDWTLQCSSYCLELNKRYEDNPVEYYIITNAVETKVYNWDKEQALLKLEFSDFIDGNVKYKGLHDRVSKSKILAALIAQKEEKDEERFKFEKIPLKDLLVRFQKIHQYIWKKEKKKPSAVFEELIKLVFIKLQKDKELYDKLGAKPKPKKKDVIFSTYWIDNQTQSKNPVNDLLFKNLVTALESEIQAQNKKRIFNPNEEIELSANTIRWIVGSLESIDLFGMDEDVHGRMFDYFLDATTRGQELGQFFTPRDIVELMVGLADISVSKDHVDSVFDPCCGSGGFLIAAMSSMLKKADSLVLSNTDKKKLHTKITNESIYGIDAGNDPKMYRIARMNMYLHGDGGSNIYLADSLDKEIGEIGKSSIEYSREIKEVRRRILKEGLKFDVILSNPPFSMKYTRDDSDQLKVLEQYELGSHNSKKVKNLLSSVMCLERYHELLTESGKVLAIIDDSVLSGDSYKNVRNFIRDKFIIEGVVSLPGDAFKRSQSRVKTSILILRKKQAGEVQSNVYLDSSIRLGLEEKIAKRIGVATDDLEKMKAQEINRIVKGFKRFKAGQKGKLVFSGQNVQGRLDVKYCIKDTGRKKRKWQKSGYKVDKIKNLLTVVKTGREVSVLENNEYQFLRVNYHGDVLEGDMLSGSECSYSKLYKVKTWDIVMSNMGVGRGAIGIVPPYHQGKFISNEYTILNANSKEEAIYYTQILKTKEILGDILTTTTGMNRGRILWGDIENVEVPLFNPPDKKAEGLVKNLEEFWQIHQKLFVDTNNYMQQKSGDLELNDKSAQERWLAFKPPE
jgi:type I restriction enzyme M protein